MPVMDGYEATKRIRELPGGRQVKIVSLTASAFEEDRVAVLAAGCDEFLNKPVEEERLYETIGRLLGLNYRYRSEALPVAVLPVADLDLASLPAELRQKLKTAADAQEVDVVRDLVKQIAAEHAELGKGLGDLVNGFRFDQISKLCEKS